VAHAPLEPPATEDLSKDAPAMNRKTLIAVAAFAALGLLALLALRQPEKGEGVGDRQRPLAKIDAGALDTITVTRAGVVTTLKREGGKFKVTTPVAYAADDAAAKGAFDALEKLTLGNLVSENKAKQAEFDVDDAKGIHVVAKGAAGQVLADLYVGKIVASGTMVRVAGKDQVWQAMGPLRSDFDKGPADFRDRSVTTFSADDAEMVTVKAKDGGIAIVKKTGKSGGGEAKWEVVTAVPKVDKLDNAIPNGIVQALSSLKTNDFADGATLAATGLDAPTLTVTVALKGGKNATLLVGNKKGADELYVKTPDVAQIFVSKTFNLERVAKRPIEFKDKLLADVAEADLAEVAVTRGENSFTLVHEAAAWKATKPAKLVLDPARAPSIAGGFKDWKATSFAEDTSPSVTGLAKPKAVVVAKTKKGETTTFKVGEDAKDKTNVYLQSSKSPDVYLVPKWSVDRLLVKVDDLKKK
jgi:hypothetical protein